MVSQSFASRVLSAIATTASPICVGIDPRPELLPSSIRAAAAQSLRHQARAYTRFAEIVLDGVAGIAPIVKFQIAFYEALGVPGVRAYCQSIREARARGFLVIGDIKRGDIGSTSAAYADAHVGPTAASSACDADAVTLSPYLGYDAIEPFRRYVERDGKGLFILVRTSNPSAGTLQDETLASGKKVYQHVADTVASWAEGTRDPSGYSSIGMVIGATNPVQLKDLREAHPGVLFLIPGYGAQGGTAAAIAPAFDAEGRGSIVSSSREIISKALQGGDDSRASSLHVRAAAEAMRSELAAARRAPRK